jgi:Domain of unknown function (DUF4192)
MSNTIRTAADLLAGLPALMGYVPTNRIIAVTTHRPDKTDGESVRAAAAIPVDTPERGVTGMVGTCGFTVTNTAGVFLVAICDAEQLRPATRLLDVLRDAFTDADIPVRKRIYTCTVAEDGQWLDIDSGDTGDTVAYTNSLHTVRAVAAGTVIAASRDDLYAEFTEATPAPIQAVPTQYSAGDAVRVCTELAEVLVGRAAMTPAMAGRIGVALTASPRLRDALLALGIEQRAAAAQLWVRIASHLRGPARLEALTVSATLFYIAHETVRASVALEVTEKLAAQLDVAFPGLAHLLDTALSAGIPPTDILAVLQRAANDMND